MSNPVEQKHNTVASAIRIVAQVSVLPAHTEMAQCTDGTRFFFVL